MHPKFGRCEFGNIQINGKNYGENDIIVFWDKVEEHEKKHEFTKRDFEELLLRDPEAIIIGTGFGKCVKVDSEIQLLAKAENIEIHILQTPQAIEKFKELLKQGKRIIAYIHPTC